MNDPKEILEIIKYYISKNIFLTDFKTDRETKKRLSRETVKEFIWPGFWWSSIFFFGKGLAEKSKLKMLNRISEIYNIPVPADYDKELIKTIKKDDSKLTKLIKTIGTFIAGAWNKDEISKIGDEIIKEFDCIYAIQNVLDLYLDMAKKYNKSFDSIKNMYKCFAQDYWYDIKLENLKK